MEFSPRHASRPSSTVTLLLALLIACGAVPATAAVPTIFYILTAGSDKITFSLPQVPTPNAPCFRAGFCVSPVTITINGNTFSDGTVGFYTPDNGGGLTIQKGGALLVNQGGPGYIQGVAGTGMQLFTGTLANPTLETFLNLQLVGASSNNPQYNESFLLTATTCNANAPRPDGIVNTGAQGWGIYDPKTQSVDPRSVTKATFNIALAGSSDFSGSTIKEVDPGGARDDCYFAGSTVGPFSLANGVWKVRSSPTSNFIDPPLDLFGLNTDQVDAYRRERTAQGLPLPCQIVLLQQMTITSAAGTSVCSFGPVNRLIYTIGPVSVSAQRTEINGTTLFESKRYITQ